MFSAAALNLSSTPTIYVYADELTVASLHASAVESVSGPGQISDVSAALLSRATPSLRVKTLINQSILLFSAPAARR